MTASELINQLRILQRRHGDLPVLIVDASGGTQEPKVEYDVYDNDEDPAFILDYNR